MKATTALGSSVVVTVGIFAISGGLLTFDRLTDEDPHSDVALVLGSMVYPDGTPSPRLEARLNRALLLYQEGSVQTLLLSGGRGESGYDEAEVMAQFLRARGVPENAIILDSQGRDTWNSALQTVRLLEGTGWRSVTVVSQFFHIARAKLAFAPNGSDRSERCARRLLRASRCLFNNSRDRWIRLLLGQTCS